MACHLSRQGVKEDGEEMFQAENFVPETKPVKVLENCHTQGLHHHQERLQKPPFLEEI
jgi:hypothetical protein